MRISLFLFLKVLMRHPVLITYSFHEKNCSISGKKSQPSQEKSYAEENKKKQKIKVNTV